jgi:hypothetical protein
VFVVDAWRCGQAVRIEAEVLRLLKLFTREPSAKVGVIKPMITKSIRS